MQQIYAFIRRIGNQHVILSQNTVIFQRADFSLLPVFFSDIGDGKSISGTVISGIGKNFFQSYVCCRNYGKIRETEKMTADRKFCSGCKNHAVSYACRYGTIVENTRNSIVHLNFGRFENFQNMFFAVSTNAVIFKTRSGIFHFDFTSDNRFSSLIIQETDTSAVHIYIDGTVFRNLYCSAVSANSAVATF